VPGLQWLSLFFAPDLAVYVDVEAFAACSLGSTSISFWLLLLVSTNILG
jgi:hypothetical protein